MIREFIFGDQKAIALLEEECFITPWSERAILDSYNNSTLFLLFEEEGEILGYVGLQIVLDEGYITNVAVTKKARKRGVGSALISRLKEVAKEKGLRFISLEVRKSNAAAIALYEKQGFKAAGLRKNFYCHPTEDGLIMTTEGF